jgi:hypothetical protein
MVSILKLGKDPTLSFSYRPVSLLDISDNLFGKILLSKVLWEVNSFFGYGKILQHHMGQRPALKANIFTSHFTW